MQKPGALPFKIRITTLKAANARIEGITKRKDRAAELSNRQNEKATVLQSRFRASRARKEYNELKSQPLQEICRRRVVINGRDFAAVVCERRIPGRPRSLMTYTLTEQPGGKQYIYNSFRDAPKGMNVAEAESSANRLIIDAEDRLRMRKAGDGADAAGLSEIKDTDQVDDNEEHKLESYEKVPFDSIERVQFCVDGAIGLPDNVIATRVGAQLLTPERARIGPLVSSIGDADSSATNPKLNVFVTWRASEVTSPTPTIVCRVDVLERPSMRTVVLGYAALKLCVDENGAQPLYWDATPGRVNKPVFLNAGKFLIPINVSTLPEWGVFSEEAVESLAPVPGAFLCVRLFDGKVENPPPHVVPPRNVENAATGLIYGVDTREAVTIAMSVYSNKRSASLPPLPLADSPAGRDFTAGRKLPAEDHKHLIQLTNQWLSGAFTPYDAVTDTINRHYLLKYNDDVGFLASVDALRNMPLPRDLPAKALVSYKACFEYLRADGVPAEWSEEIGDNPESFVDDLGMQWDFDLSSQHNIFFQDGFRKDLKKFRMGPKSCILVLVTSVVMTPNYSEKGALDISVDLCNGSNSYWGVIPLLDASPFEIHSDSPVVEKDYYYVNAGLHQVPLFEGTPPDALFHSRDPINYIQTELNTQRLNRGDVQSSASAWSSFMCTGASAVQSEGVVLSRGASAILRLIDRRLEAMAPEAIYKESNVYPEESTLELILSSFPKVMRSNLLSQFRYNALAFEEAPKLGSMLPAEVTRERLMKGVNILFKKEGEELLEMQRERQLRA